MRSASVRRTASAETLSCSVSELPRVRSPPTTTEPVSCSLGLIRFTCARGMFWPAPAVAPPPPTETCPGPSALTFWRTTVPSLSFIATGASVEKVRTSFMSTITSPATLVLIFIFPPSTELIVPVRRSPLLNWTSSAHACPAAQVENPAVNSPMPTARLRRFHRFAHNQTFIDSPYPCDIRHVHARQGARAGYLHSPSYFADYPFTPPQARRPASSPPCSART